MNNKPLRPCAGIMCPHHADCESYKLVDGYRGPETIRGTCDPERKVWPLFVAIKEAA